MLPPRVPAHCTSPSTEGKDSVGNCPAGVVKGELGRGLGTQEVRELVWYFGKQEAVEMLAVGEGRFLLSPTL